VEFGAAVLGLRRNRDSRNIDQDIDAFLDFDELASLGY
jgi:hypothetical protein